ncbi:sll0787 family AIR synthase-like protein [Pseudanabaena sp. PCC 6802]|uniref:sll0787 family AIR synthase-like protein n=1 Tax=Pseudanabaena sp. PCC 6802 TaxID=118173 RepID=UPI00034A2A3F|nr:sll0787 family AIR synthase-like protein [Pseudanabaena sp. PCC 6802]
MLASLAVQLRQSLSLLQKQDIQIAAKFHSSFANKTTSAIRVGDDCAAIPDGDGYLLFAAEGMLPEFLETEPWFAGWSAIMVNASDIYAMGGRPIAVVDTLWSQPQDTARISIDRIWAGMNAAAQAYQIPIVGGHTNCHSTYNALSVAILGRAQKLISSFTARPGDRLLLAIDLRGKPHPHYPFWDAATTAPPERLRQNLAILPHLAEAKLCDTGKDISNGGLIGTVLMLLETSSCGAVLNLDWIPRPDGVSLDRWLLSFPSYGFLLSVRRDRVAAVRDCFQEQDLICAIIGEVEVGAKLTLRSQQEEVLFWDLEQKALTGFGGIKP